MDLNDAIDLATSATESVLRFHIDAWKKAPRAPFVDIKAFRSAVQYAVRKLASKKKKRKKRHHHEHEHEHEHGHYYYLNEHDGSVHLARVAGLAGDAAFRVATEWNAMTDPTNHVRPDWLRDCVCTLVQGAVPESMATTTTSSVPARRPYGEYLDPSGDLLMLDAGRAVESADEHDGAPEEDEDEKEEENEKVLTNYYGFEPPRVPAKGVEQQQQQQQQQTTTIKQTPQEEDVSPQPASFIKSAWHAINKYAAHPFSATAAAKCHATLASLVPKKRKAANSLEHDEEENEEDDEEVVDDGGQRHGDDDDDDDDEDDDDDNEGAAAAWEGQATMKKRARVIGRRVVSHKGLGLLGGGLGLGQVGPSHHHHQYNNNNNKNQNQNKNTLSRALMPRSGNARKPKSFWTKQEELMLVSARQAGKSWNAVHELLGHRTATACEKKYRDLNTSSHFQQAQSLLSTTAVAQQEEQQLQQEEEEEQNMEEEVEEEVEEELPVATGDESGDGDQEMGSDEEMEDIIYPVNGP